MLNVNVSLSTDRGISQHYQSLAITQGLYIMQCDCLSDDPKAGMSSGNRDSLERTLAKAGGAGCDVSSRGNIFTDDIKFPFQFNGQDSLNIMMVVKENIYPTLPSNKTSWCHLSVLQDQSMFKCTRLRFCVVFKLNTNIRALTLKLFHVAVLMSYSRYIFLVSRKMSMVHCVVVYFLYK